MSHARFVSHARLYKLNEERGPSDWQQEMLKNHGENGVTVALLQSIDRLPHSQINDFVINVQKECNAGRALQTLSQVTYEGARTLLYLVNDLSYTLADAQITIKGQDDMDLARMRVIESPTSIR